MRPLEMVFATNFSDSCFKATQAVAQWVDDFDLRLTLLHTYDPGAESQAAAESKLQSFFPEADRYGICRRVVRPGPVLPVIEKLREQNAVDLVIAPASDPFGLPRLWSSTRAKLVADLGIAVWTAGHDVTPSKLRGRPSRIACWLDFDAPDGTDPIDLASEYAARLGASLHLLYAVPEITEGMTSTKKPLSALEATELARSRMGRHGQVAEVHATLTTGRRAMIELVNRSAADVLIVGRRSAISHGLFGLRLNSGFADVSCPVIALGERGLAPSLLQTRAQAAVPSERAAGRRLEVSTATFG